MKRFFFCLLLNAYYLLSFSQPKLVVGIVVDQMRYDYIQKYWNKFGKDGFRRLMEQGYSCNHTYYNYVPTFTGPGHASIYTGGTLSAHGIIANAWVDRNTGHSIYCVADKSVNTVGSASAAGQMSPLNLLSSTVGEELRKKNDNASKVIGIALKDRGAILPAGHKANAAYWYDPSSGNWITSAYYMKELPSWVNDFNKKESAKKYLSQQWITLLPLENYTESEADDNVCETPFKGKEKSVFPYDLPSLMKRNGELGLIQNTPFGNSFTKDFAIQVLQHDSMGKGKVTDLLCLSFSSTDYIGHQFGPQSVEVEDCYLRLDTDIADLLKFLDGWVGKDNALVFLTSDHGASESVPCLQKKNIPSGVMEGDVLSDSLKNFFIRTYKDSILLKVSDFDIYLDRKKIEKKKFLLEEVQKKTANYLLTVQGIAEAITATQLQHIGFTDSIKGKVKNGFYPSRDGDVLIVLKKYWHEGFPKGTSHGSPYEYDTHVPLIWWGYRIKRGSSADAVYITQIAPTLSKFLNVPAPNSCESTPIHFPK